MPPRIQDMASHLRSRILIVNGCWEWQGCKNNKGYGQIRIGNKGFLTHRISYETFVGLIPTGLTLDHLCRNPCCINPEHLEPVLHAENMRRGVIRERRAAAQRAKTHCPQGHPYSGENLMYTIKGQRRCRECVNRCSRRYYKKNSSQIKAYHKKVRRRAAKLRSRGR